MDYQPLPAPQNGSAFLVGGPGFVFLKRQVAGLDPGRTYRAVFAAQIATQWSAQCYYTDDGPWSTYVRAGATMVEPSNRVETAGVPPYVFQHVLPDFDLTSTGVVLGDIANSQPCLSKVWEMKTLQSTAAVSLTADSTGRVWLYQGVNALAGLPVYFVTTSATLSK
ncbi:MAG TPA: hypothetical protein VJN96_08415 [Vicinamibacterales bacterium]|nr:hypothetical protein [Vicinamibacterales bacterium]